MTDINNIKKGLLEKIEKAANAEEANMWALTYRTLCEAQNVERNVQPAPAGRPENGG